MSRTTPGALAALLSCLPAVCGCASTGTGWFERDGFRHLRYPYGVRYRQAKTLVSTEWLLDNFRDVDGELERKVEGEYESEIELDLDDDGRLDGAQKVPRYDLLLRHRRGAGEIWIRTVPIARRLDQTDLRVLLQFYVDALAGAGWQATRIGPGRSAGVERRFAARIVNGAPAIVADREAFGATIEIANLDQLELSPQSRWERARIVLVRSGFLWHTAERPDTEDLFPVLMLIGYTNLPDDFDRGVPDFESFVAQIRFEERDDLRRAVSRCAPDRQMIRVVSVPWRWGNQLLSPDLEGDRLDCVSSAIDDGPEGLRDRSMMVFQRAPARARPAETAETEEAVDTSSSAPVEAATPVPPDPQPPPSGTPPPASEPESPPAGP